jgi:hypothetical protein
MLGQVLNIGQFLDGRYRIVQALPAGGFSQTTKTVAVGTMGYMPIEQFHGNPQFNSHIS